MENEKKCKKNTKMEGKNARKIQKWRKRARSEAELQLGGMTADCASNNKIKAPGSD